MATQAASASRLERERTASPRTIAALWRDAIAEQRPGAAYLVETPEGWRAVGWAQVGRRVDDLASGLLALGVR